MILPASRKVACRKAMSGLSALCRQTSLGALSVSALIVGSMLATPVTAHAGQEGSEIVDQVYTEPRVDDDIIQNLYGMDDMDVLSADADFETADTIEAEAPHNGIPTVTIFVQEGWQDIGTAVVADGEHRYGGWDELFNSADHSVRGVGSIAVTVPEGYAGEYGDATVPAGKVDLAFIRGRGNSTWMRNSNPPSKRAFKLKLQDKQDFFGMGASKEWALMANTYDDSLLHNRITSWLAGQVGMPYVPQMVPVDLVLVRVRDGEELERKRLGSYCLSELVDIEPGRVAIDKLKKADTSEDDITGGYLLSIYNSEQNADVSPDNRIDLWNKTLFFRSPEFEGEDLSGARGAQRDYMRGYLEELETLILGDDRQGETFIDDERHDAIAAMMDLRSLADYFWMQELAGNMDAFISSSTYLYKPRGGKLCWGPVWDFDLAWRYGTEGFGYGRSSWLRTLRWEDPHFAKLLRERWSDPRDGMDAKLGELTRPGGILDQYREEIRASWEEDATLNPVQDSSFRRKADALPFDETIERLRSYIDGRRDWINKHLDEAAARYVTVSFKVEGREVKRECVDLTSDQLNWPEDPAYGAYEFVGWCKEGTDEVVKDLDVCEDTVFVAKFKPMDLGEVGVPKGASLFPNEVLFLNGSCHELICDGRVVYRASVLLPNVEGCDWSDSRMSFVVRPANAAKGQAKKVELPFDKATKAEADGGRTIATFELPLSAIEMGQTIESAFSYSLAGKACTEVHEETLENQLVSYDKWGVDRTWRAYARALHDFGRTAYAFLGAHGNGNVTEDRYAPMQERYTERFDRAGTKAGLKVELEAAGVGTQLAGSQVKRVGMSLRLDSTATLVIDVEAKKGVRNMACQATFKGRPAKVKKVSETQWRVTVEGIRAQDLDSVVDITGDAGGAFTVRCSALSYASAILEKGAYGDEGSNLACALFNYHKAAEAIAG